MLGGRSWDDWIAQYAGSHQHPVNRVCHTIGIPLIVKGPNADAYSEGSPDQYRFSASHQTRALIGLYGGAEPFTRILDRFIRGASKDRGAVYPGAQYWHGNEHDMHAIYLFNEAGHPELTQKWARWALPEGNIAASPSASALRSSIKP